MSENQIVLLPDCRSWPQFCQYVPGPCDQDFGIAVHSDALFLFPSTPVSVSNYLRGLMDSPPSAMTLVRKKRLLDRIHTRHCGQLNCREVGS